MFQLKVFASQQLRHFSTTVCQIVADKPSGTVTIQGWVKSLRTMKDKIFFDIRDGSSPAPLQIVVNKSQKPNNLTVGASVQVTGQTAFNTKGGNIEIAADNIQVIGNCNLSEYPFSPRHRYTPEYLRQYLHLRPRTNFASVLRVRHRALNAIHTYLDARGFYHVNTPILTSNDCEGAGECFKVQPDSREMLLEMSKLSSELDEDRVFFNDKVYLSVSGQLQLEAAAHSLVNVYNLGPIFRAENSKSRLHLSEFYMLEVERAFCTGLQTLVEDVEDLLKVVSKKVLDECEEDVNSLTQGTDSKPDFGWLDRKFAVMTYREAVELLIANKDRYVGSVAKYGVGLTKEHELFLVGHNGNVPMFVVDWPKELKPFYMKSVSNDEVAAFDLLAPVVGELFGGSLRENDYETLKRNIPTHLTSLEWYLDLRKFGSVPTGGYGMGFERFLQSLLNISNIKDTIPFPRWPHNCSL